MYIIMKIEREKSISLDAIINGKRISKEKKFFKTENEKLTKLLCYYKNDKKLE